MQSQRDHWLRIWGGVFGAIFGGVGGVFAAIALNLYVYRDSGAGVAGGGDGIETVLIGYVVYGVMGLLLGGLAGGILGSRAAGA